MSRRTARLAGGPRILFATSNGTGLGHLNRAMAIARRLPDGFRSSFFTLSAAAPVVAAEGWEVDYLASYRRPASGTDRAWNLRLGAMLEQVLAEREPDLVVFDGVHPYRALTHLLSARGAPPSIWCRRPMWRADSSTAPLQRAGAFDAILEPGELAEAADPGPTVARRRAVKRVRPIVFLDRDELLPRDRAAAELGIDPSRRTALVTLGQGGEVDGAVARSLASLTAVPGLQVVALQSSLSAALEVPGDVIRLRATFPMSRYFAAVDLAVAAAGYNAFHELIDFAVPTLFVPMSRDTDDQAARARWAAEAGAGLAVTGADDAALEERLGELAEPARTAELAAGCERVFPGNGAAEAAELVVRMLGRRAARPGGSRSRPLQPLAAAVEPSRRAVPAARRRARSPRSDPSPGAPFRLPGRPGHGSTRGRADRSAPGGDRGAAAGAGPGPDRLDGVRRPAPARRRLRAAAVLAGDRRRAGHDRSPTCAPGSACCWRAASRSAPSRSAITAPICSTSWPRPNPTGRPDHDPPCGTLGGAYGGSGPD